MNGRRRVNCRRYAPRTFFAVTTGYVLPQRYVEDDCVVGGAKKSVKQISLDATFSQSNYVFHRNHDSGIKVAIFPVPETKEH